MGLINLKPCGDGATLKINVASIASTSVEVRNVTQAVRQTHVNVGKNWY